jgi:hypothetical protein
MAGKVTQSTETYTTGSGYSASIVKVVTLNFTGSHDDGTVPDTDLAADLKGFSLYSIEYYPGLEAPDTADVTVLNEAGLDLLGAKGASLITAATKAISFPFSVFSGLYFYPIINSALTVSIANQDTIDATWSLVLTFKQ